MEGGVHNLITIHVGSHTFQTMDPWAEVNLRPRVTSREHTVGSVEYSNIDIRFLSLTPCDKFAT